jgi:hypothetical protein
MAFGSQAVAGRASMRAPRISEADGATAFRDNYYCTSVKVVQ